MIITENLFAIEAKTKELAKLITRCDQAKNYHLASVKYFKDKKILLLEQTLRSTYNAFLQIKEYRSNDESYKEKKYAFYQAKRVYDLNESVADLRLAYMDMQNILDEIASKIANKVSKKIAVKTGNSFSDYKEKANCHSCFLNQKKERLS
ncbi:MAG: YlbF family regulator [Lactobacillales bacterium]|jgi:cell fate (sporulation/competence/biofilm development) regulator YlbF (YheA/YmcA/DUF963 family)|nr:YlbF family regulator [Lactobacillales bacterium]